MPLDRRSPYPRETSTACWPCTSGGERASGEMATIRIDACLLAIQRRARDAVDACLTRPRPVLRTGPRGIGGLHALVRSGGQ